MKNIINVEGKQVFTAQWVWEQMSAQNVRIDRANTIAAVSVCVSIAAVITAIAAVIL
ncbi:hypothetical protein [Angelakisella massiliensis]|uniref:hypothetical protein n=1 Tax=Angelakisella massiliensis TaxID=1871018 RepID=UPI0024B0A6CD|nr:hypothetical protein [Angelakisella massiliensis]